VYTSLATEENRSRLEYDRDVKGILLNSTLYDFIICILRIICIFTYF